MKDEEIAEEYLRIGSNSPITKILYAMKNKGKIPYIAMEVINGKVELAKLIIGSLALYFHGTTDKNGKNLEVKKNSCPKPNCKGKHFKIPFDGYEMSIQKDYENYEG